MTVQRRRFSEEFKLQVVQEVLSGERQASIARRHSVSANTILQWLKAYKTGRLGGEATGDPSLQASTSISSGLATSPTRRRWC